MDTTFIRCGRFSLSRLSKLAGVGRVYTVNLPRDLSSDCGREEKFDLLVATNILAYVTTFSRRWR